MSDNTLYYHSSASENLGSNTAEFDPNEATSSNVRKNFVFKNYITREPLVGTMPVNDPEIIYLAPSSDESLNSYIIPKGYHDGTGKVIAERLSDHTYGNAIPGDLAKNKIAWVNGKKIIGTLDIESVTQKGDATENDIMDTRTAWVNGEKITGKIPWLYRKDINLSAGQSYTYPYGLSPGTSIISALPLSVQTVANAKSKDIVEGKTAWVNGELVSGSLAVSYELSEKLKDTDTITSNVLSGKKFYSNILKNVAEGSMTDHSGEPEITLNPGSLWYIPEGYYNGLSKVRVESLDTLTAGDAISDNILINKTAWVNGVKIIGSMLYNETTSISIGADDEYTIPEGYHTGNGKVIGKSIELQTYGNATDNDILNGKTAWVNGEKITGNIDTYGNIDINLKCDEHYHIPKGYHDGTGWVWTNSLSSQTEATATYRDILQGKTAWVSGLKITGNIPLITPVTKILEDGEKFVIEKGYHDGTGWVKSKTGGEITPGTATKEDILQGKTAWVNGEKITGSLDLYNSTATEDDVVLGKTFYKGKDLKTGTLALDATALAENVAKGYTFYNTDLRQKVTGTMELTGSATNIRVLEGYTFYNSDPSYKIEGAMPNIGAVEKIINPSDKYTIPQGYHNGDGFVQVPSLSQYTIATATPSQILEGKTAWVNGVKITGNIETKFQSSITLSAGEHIDIPAGYYPNGFTITARDLESQTPGTADSNDMFIDTTAWVNGEQITGDVPDGDEIKY